MGKRIIFSLIIALTSLIGLQTKTNADYWLVVGSYRQGPGRKPEEHGAL